MSGLSSKDLNKFGKKIIGKEFLGVFPSDIHPFKINRKNSFFLIFNLSKYYQKGSHFIAIVKIKNKIIYFDPLGKKCSNIGILKFLLKTKTKVIYNTKKIQSDFSIFCGFFCLSFLIAMSNNYSLTDYLNLFSESNFVNNDKRCVEYIVNKIKQK